MTGWIMLLLVVLMLWVTFGLVSPREKKIETWAQFSAFINDGKTGPLPVAEYSAMLMHVCQGKCYTPAEYGAILAELDFEVSAYEDTIADRGFMTAVKK